MPRKKHRLSIQERIGFLKDAEIADVNHPEIKELLHELQVYKIELEMQNEELRTAQHELEESRNKYLSLFETAPVGFFTLDRKGLILEVNEKGAALAGVPRKRLNGERFQQYIHPDYLPAFHNFFTGPLNSSIKVPEIQLMNTGRFVQMEGLFVNRQAAGLVCQLALVDVTLRKKQEEEYAIQKLSQQKETLNTILQTQEEERLRIAEALHNGLGQLLYAAKLKLEDVKENKTVKKQLQDFLNDAITETRNLSFTLMPTLLKDFGLKVILEETAKRFSTEKFHLECKVTGFKTRLPGVQEIAVFRIVQELLNNVLKHSNATKAAIHVKKQKENIHIRVKDNGKGFDADRKLQAKFGTGLATVSNRLQLLNGRMNIASECGKGTTVTIVL